jgi:hypothetical protein
MAKIIETIRGIPITITPKYVEFGKNPGNWESKMFPMNQIERVEVGFSSIHFVESKSHMGSDLIIVTRAGCEKIHGRDITVEQAKEACSLIRKYLNGDHEEDKIIYLNSRVDLLDEDMKKQTQKQTNEIKILQGQINELKNIVYQQETLIGELLERLSVKSVPEEDLLG